MLIRCGILIVGILFLAIRDLPGAQERIYGLEHVKIVNVFDINRRPERLSLVSGSLKLAGGIPGGNVWEMLTYIPHKAVAPKSDYGIFRMVGNRIVFYSFQMGTSYIGKVLENGEFMEIQKLSWGGRSQTEIWYFVR